MQTEKLFVIINGLLFDEASCNQSIFLVNSSSIFLNYDFQQGGKFKLVRWYK